MDPDGLADACPECKRDVTHTQCDCLPDDDDVGDEQVPASKRQRTVDSALSDSEDEHEHQCLCGIWIPLTAQCCGLFCPAGDTDSAAETEANTETATEAVADAAAETIVARAQTLGEDAQGADE